MADDGHALVAMNDVHAFVVRCLSACSVSRDHADAMAEILVAADYWGHVTHGATLIDVYVDHLKSNLIAREGNPKVLKETVATALVDGQNLLGPVVGNFCMDLAIEKAKVAGIGWVVARGSNHFGITGWYGQRALKQGMMGMAFTNGSPLLVPTRAKKPTLGTNTISVAAPANDGDSFLLDMATTTVAYGKVRVKEQTNQRIPEGWLLDKDGNPTTDTKQGVHLTPLGGAEKTSGYKGYGLSMMVDVLTGVLSGANYSYHVPCGPEAKERNANLGHCFVAINPGVFAEGFADRLSDLMSYCRNLEPVEGEKEVLVPGDKEKRHQEKCDKQGGVLYHPNHMEHMNNVARSLGVEPLKVKPSNGAK